MFNGLKEGVIERAGEITDEKIYKGVMDTNFTLVNGGKLHCRHILFSNWMPSINSNDDYLRKSIHFFTSKSIDYAVKKKNSTSIAFAVSELSKNEYILAYEMINTAKQKLLESNRLRLKILFILLPEQRTLHNQFFDLIEMVGHIYAQFYWPLAGTILMN